jgi:hypothetical protein
MFLTKVIDVSDEAEPLPKGYNFSAPEPEIDPDASVFDSGSISPSHVAEDEAGMALTGMAPKLRDPAGGMIPQAFIRKHGGLPFGYTVAEESTLIQNFLARHGLRLIGFFPKVRAGRLICNGAVQNGLTVASPRETKTAKGDRWVTPSEEARLRRYNPISGEAAHAAQEKIRRDAGVYEERLSVTESGMSLGDGKNYRLSWDGAYKAYRKAVPESQKLPKEGKLPERHCRNPECLKEIGEKKHHNIEYCGSLCRERAKELRRRHKVNQTGRPIIYRNESDVSADLTSDTKQLETDVISPHIYRGIVSKDCPEEVAVYQQ